MFQLLVTNDIASFSFEKHNIKMGYQLLSKMGYTRGGLGENGCVIIVPISIEVYTLRLCIGYIVVIITSLPIPSLSKPKEVIFVASGIQNEEQPPTDHDEINYELVFLLVETIVDDFVDILGSSILISE